MLRLGQSTQIRAKLAEILERIITPKTQVDVLREINLAKAAHRPYTLCFIGVNGVGKSTNLSKVCFWLLCNKLKVLIAACDTFRSGAVEQLRMHVKNLGKLQEAAVDESLVGSVELYEKGYGKDAAAIAKDAIAYGEANESSYNVM